MYAIGVKDGVIRCGNRYVRISPWYTGLKTSAVHSDVPTHYIGRYIWCGW